MRGKKRRRIGLWLLAAVLCIQVAAPLSARASQAPSRVINVVYDDSGSMIQTGGQNVDTWCQAKYAMEVFAALLGENDTMNIYVMSDFVNNRKGSVKLTLSGSDGQSANVAQIHNMLTRASDTPFGSVRKAYSDLTEAAADEKWLVVLTDGEFQGVDDIDGYFAQKEQDVNVMFLGMGPNAAEISQDPGYGIYFEKAATSKQILEKITGICTRIFNSDRLDVNVSAKTVSFDVPMAELVVFAQGANVTINGVTDAEGKTYLPSTAPVTVQYAEQAATNYSDFIIDRNLKGCISTFRDDFPAGSYTLDVSGADTIEIYYKPNVEIAARLTDSTGSEVTEMSSLKAGEYTITFGLVKTGTQEQVTQSSLLGEVSYSGVVTNNGVTHETPYASGDKLTIEEGSLEIDAVARFLEYNTVSTHLSYRIYTDKGLTFAVTDNPEYAITRDGLDAAEPIRVRALLEGQAISDEDWANMALPTVTAVEPEGQHLYGDFTVEKSAAPGVFELYPTLSGGSLSSQIYEGPGFTLAYENKHGDATWSGSLEGKVKVTDQRSWLERNLPLIIRCAVIAAIVLLLLGYVPPFKKYLPKNLKKSPSIKCSPNTPIVAPRTESGRFTISTASTLIPYKAQTGTIRVIPSSARVSVSSLKVKAAGGSGMYIMNIQDYAGQGHIKFDGAPVPAGTTRPMRKGAGVMISVKTDQMTYICIPSRK